MKPTCGQNLYEVKVYWQPKFIYVDNFKTTKIAISQHFMRKSGQKLPARMKYIWTCLATCSQVAAISAYLERRRSSNKPCEVKGYGIIHKKLIGRIVY